MRIREIYFHNVRAFRGEHRISFVDPLTDAVRPVTVIAGTNGTGRQLSSTLSRPCYSSWQVSAALRKWRESPSVAR